jgi:hypothetical protein
MPPRGNIRRPYSSISNRSVRRTWPPSSVVQGMRHSLRSHGRWGLAVERPTHLLRGCKRSPTMSTCRADRSRALGLRDPIARRLETPGELPFRSSKAAVARGMSAWRSPSLHRSEVPRFGPRVIGAGPLRPRVPDNELSASHQRVERGAPSASRPRVADGRSAQRGWVPCAPSVISERLVGPWDMTLLVCLVS